MEAAMVEGVMEEEGGLWLEETERWNTYDNSIYAGGRYERQAEEMISMGRPHTVGKWRRFLGVQRAREDYIYKALYDAEFIAFKAKQMARQDYTISTLM